MITTDAALFGAGRAAALLDGPRAVAVCGCGQELAGVRGHYCPRCGCTRS